MIADVLHAQPGGLIRYVITDPGYPDPFASRAVGAVQPRSIVQLAPDVQIPQAVQYSAGVDHQAQKATTVSITYKWRRADFDRRHRFLLLGRLSLVKAIDVGVGLTMNSGAPYTVTLGR